MNESFVLGGGLGGRWGPKWVILCWGWGMGDGPTQIPKRTQQRSDEGLQGSRHMFLGLNI